MRFGIFYEHQLPKPWNEGDEARLFHQALEQVVLADRLGYDYAWEVEHHFLEEYSHSSAPGGIPGGLRGPDQDDPRRSRHPPGDPQLQSPRPHAEGLATLDIVSNGRLDFGIGEGATRLELGGFGIPAKEKRAMALEAGEQIANMMVMDPYPGYQGHGFSFPCRNVVPKPMQKPHPPMWMACTNRDTIKVAASKGLGALAFSFVDPEEARNWAEIYYGIIKSEECVPIGHSVNANMAMVSNFSVHHDRAEAIRRGQEGFEFFSYAVNALVAHDALPGRSTLFADFQKSRARATKRSSPPPRPRQRNANGIGTPSDIRDHIRAFQDAGVDQVIFLQQAGRNRHEHICQSLELFAAEVMGEFKAEVAEREAKKAADLAPWIEAAMARKVWMKPLADDEIPVVPASRARAQINEAKSEA
jgi:alkanesulfonate monooxygenase SsuD/methylene tetrahydromethanopterin reductase-like flavin-dependent oxidoreductase (luciferase family)